MRYIVGQRVRIHLPGDSSLHGVLGTVTKCELHRGTRKVWAIWDDTGTDSWMRAKDVRLASKFIIGDTVSVGKKTLVVDGILKFNEKRAVLIGRKRLI